MPRVASVLERPETRHKRSECAPHQRAPSRAAARAPGVVAGAGGTRATHFPSTKSHADKREKYASIPGNVGLARSDALIGSWPRDRTAGPRSTVAPGRVAAVRSGALPASMSHASRSAPGRCQWWCDCDFTRKRGVDQNLPASWRSSLILVPISWAWRFISLSMLNGPPRVGVEPPVVPDEGGPLPAASCTTFVMKSNKAVPGLPAMG
jgi:hypothetical protein